MDIRETRAGRGEQKGDESINRDRLVKEFEALKGNHFEGTQWSTDYILENIGESGRRLLEQFIKINDKFNANNEQMDAELAGQYNAWLTELRKARSALSDQFENTPQNRLYGLLRNKLPLLNLGYEDWQKKAA